MNTRYSRKKSPLETGVALSERSESKCTALAGSGTLAAARCVANKMPDIYIIRFTSLMINRIVCRQHLFHPSNMFFLKPWTPSIPESSCPVCKRLHELVILGLMRMSFSVSHRFITIKNIFTIEIPGENRPHGMLNNLFFTYTISHS